MKTRNILIAVVCLLSTISTRSETLVDTVLAAYGADAFKNVNEIRFTFHGKIFGIIGPSRTWVWKPKADSVISVDKGVSYSRKSMNTDQREIDKEFTNDHYWLTFPFHLAWDKSVRIEIDSGLTPSPRNKKPLRRIVVTYQSGGGYTPNDAYQVWVEANGLISEWKYHKGGNMQRGFAWSWEDHVQISGLTFSRLHRGPVRVKLTDIQVK